MVVSTVTARRRTCVQMARSWGRLDPTFTEECERREMSLGKWCPPGVRSPMVQPDQGPHLVGARSLGRMGRHRLRVGVTDLAGKQWSDLAPEDRDYRHVRRPP